MKQNILNQILNKWSNLDYLRSNQEVYLAYLQDPVIRKLWWNFFNLGTGPAFGRGWGFVGINESTFKLYATEYLFFDPESKLSHFVINPNSATPLFIPDNIFFMKCRVKTGELSSILYWFNADSNSSIIVENEDTIKVPLDPDTNEYMNFVGPPLNLRLLFNIYE